MAKTYLIKDKFNTFFSFWNFCKSNNVRSLNYNNLNIKNELFKVYTENKNTKITKIGELISTHLKLLGTYTRQEQFYIRRGYSTQYSKDIISKRQSKTSLKNATKGSLKGRFSKEWFQKKYGEDWEEHYKAKHQSTAPSLERYIQNYGEEEGKIKWKEFGVKLNSNVTKEGMILKYGEEEGSKKYIKYCERQAYTCSVEYFIEKYGETEGKEKWLKSYGHLSRYSAISKKMFDELLELCSFPESYKDEIYYAENEWNIFLNQKERRETRSSIIRPDFKMFNKVIEFQGDNIHGNPKIFKSTDLITYANINIPALGKWFMDYVRNDIMYNRGFKVLVIWESDYKKNPASILDRCRIFLTSDLQLDFKI
jgi:hypothetical protein